MVQTSAQNADLDAVNAIPIVSAVFAQPITICHQAHAKLVMKANMHLLDQLTHLHASLVRMKNVSPVAQPTPLASVPSVKNRNSPYQVFARIAKITTVSLVQDLELEDVLLVTPIST